MKENKIITWLIPILLGTAGMIIIFFWLTHNPAADLVLHGPDMDGKPEGETESQTVQIGEHFEIGNGVAATDMSGSWPRFRGENFSNIWTEDTVLADHWQDNEPEVIWSVPVGEGHAGAAINNGRVYFLDYDESRKRDALRCLSLKDGEEIWRRSYDVTIQRNHGMSRTVPAVTDSYVVTIGPKCHVMCVDAESGDLLWSIDLVEEYGANVPMWYTGQCPLIDDGTAVLVPAGKEVLMMGVDCATGEVVWQTPNPDQLEMSHSSIMPAVIDGVSMYVYSALGGMVGVGAEEENLGEVLWQVEEWDRSVIAPSPIIFEDGRIFVTSGYGGGSMMVRIDRDEDGIFNPEILQTVKANEGLASEQQTPVVYDGYLFGILPNDAGTRRNQLVCVNPDDISEFIWTSGQANRFGLGPYLIADDKLYLLNEDGLLKMIRLDTDGYEVLDKKQVIVDAHDAWAPMAIADGLLVLRDDTRMFCVDLP